MKNKNILSFMTAITLMANTLPLTMQYAIADDEIEKYTVTFLNFDGTSVIATQEVSADEPIDYSVIDTDSLKVNLSKTVQRKFVQWDTDITNVDKDTTITALYSEAEIKIESIPSNTFYTNKIGNIDTTGLSVIIYFTTQTTEFDENQERILTYDTLDVSKSCYTSPKTLSEAFANSNTAVISIYPISSNVPLISYSIGLVLPDLLGDVSLDGTIDSFDSSLILSHYAKMSSSEESPLTDKQLLHADVNSDNIIDSYDASCILKYYSEESSNKTPSFY